MNIIATVLFLTTAIVQTANATLFISGGTYLVSIHGFIYLVHIVASIFVK
jgi:hypothetical protein